MTKTGTLPLANHQQLVIKYPMNGWGRTTTKSKPCIVRGSVWEGAEGSSEVPNGPEKRRIHTELMDTHWEALVWGRNLKRTGETRNSSAQSTNGQSGARRSVQGLKDEAVQIS